MCLYHEIVDMMRVQRKEVLVPTISNTNPVDSQEIAYKSLTPVASHREIRQDLDMIPNQKRRDIDTVTKHQSNQVPPFGTYKKYQSTMKSMINGCKRFSFPFSFIPVLFLEYAIMAVSIFSFSFPFFFKVDLNDIDSNGINRSAEVWN